MTPDTPIGESTQTEVLMELKERLKQHRVKHIVSSYQLDGEEPEAFDRHLEELFQTYPTPLIELALVETLLDNWAQVPMPRGCAFLIQAHRQLKRWEGRSIASTIAPVQFQQITGLDPSPIFGTAFSSPPSLRQGNL